MTGWGWRALLDIIDRGALPLTELTALLGPGHGATLLDVETLLVPAGDWR